MGTTTTLSSLELSDDSFSETGIFLEEEMPGELQVHADQLYMVPLSFLCTVHSKLYNNSALNLLRMVFNL